MFFLKYVLQLKKKVKVCGPTDAADRDVIEISHC